MKHFTIQSSADQISQSTGIALTEKRRKIFDIIIKIQKPISAYEIVDQYNELYSTPIPVMSVYRILKFLCNVNLVHKLDSINQYILCEHISCDHEHLNAQFLICDDCKNTEEVVLKESIHKQLTDDIAQTGFKLNHLQFELHGLCSSCQLEK